MKLDLFRESLKGAAPPSDLSLLLQALWYDGKGAWQQAHQLVQDEPGAGAALIHAYLHRKEGDNWNADYWYRLAGEKRPLISLEQEWESLVARFAA
jgi:hypothetical protein